MTKKRTLMKKIKRKHSCQTKEINANDYSSTDWEKYPNSEEETDDEE